MLKIVFNEAEAQKVLVMTNEKIAHIFLTEPKPVQFVFVDYIPSQQRGKECLGMCSHSAPGFKCFNEIRIKVWPGWQNTAIHELAHLYSPGCTEKRTVEIANDITRYLKRLDNSAYRSYNDNREGAPC